MAVVQNTEIGAYHFSANKEMYEIQRGNNFEFQIDARLAENLTAWGDDTRSLTDAVNTIRLSVAAASVPHFSQSVIDVRRGNTAVKYAGVISYGPGTLQCYDFIGPGTKDILMAWQAKSGDPYTQKVGRQADYKYNCTLIEYPPDYDENEKRTWTLEGCWISEISEEDYSVDADGSRRISVTIQYDRARPDYDI